MTPASDTDAHDTLGPAAAGMDRYDSFESDGALVVYDLENENAWLQSDDHVDLAEWR